MTTVYEKPFSKDELEELIRCDDIMAAMKNPNTGEFIVRNAESRREFEIRVVAMKYYLKSAIWSN